MDYCNKRRPPYHIPGYDGKIPGDRFHYGQTFGDGSAYLLTKRRELSSATYRGERQRNPYDPCEVHKKELRARLHMVQGEIDPNPCAGVDWNSRNKFCVTKPVIECPPKLQRRNQHGYMSRMSVYSSPDLGIAACRGGVISEDPCDTKAKPGVTNRFAKEYEEVTNYDPFKEYEPECRHLRLPKVKYDVKCWDEEFVLPEECVEDYTREGYIRPPLKCECVPFESRKKDSIVKYYRHEPNPSQFQMPYFADPSNPYRFFIPGYDGYVPHWKFLNGYSYGNGTRMALNKFTLDYMTPHLLEREPVYIAGNQLCDDFDYFKCYCERRKSYDGHFHEKPVRDRLKTEYDPKKCCIPPVACEDEDEC